MNSNFTHIHHHSEYSTLDGVNRVSEVPGFCKDLGQTALAITDHGNVAGHWAFYKSCIAAGIKPILGMEAYYAMGSRHTKAKDELGRPYYHMVLLAKSNEGLHNLFKLSSYSFADGMFYKPRLDDELLAQYNKDLYATSACLGSRSSQLIMRGDYKAAEQILDHHASIFKDRFFIELQTHRGPEQQKVNEVLIQIANKKNLPLVLTADAHYTHQHDKHFHETTLKMATNSTEDGFSFGDIECHLCSHDEIWGKAQLQNIPYEAVSNTRYIADSIDASSYFSDRKNRWPRFRSLPEGVTSWQYLEALARSGLYKRIGFPLPSGYEERMLHEISLFKYMNLCDYMLIVSEYTAKARELGILVGPGRGSAAGSLVAYAIGITELDPIKYGLILERFVNPGRVGTPLIF